MNQTLSRSTKTPGTAWRTVMGALVALLIPALSLAAVRRETIEKTLPASDVDDVSIENVNGDVTVSGAPGDSISITAEKTVRGGDVERLLRELDVRIQKIGRRLEIETIHPKRKKLFGLIQLGSSGSTSVKYTLRIPPSRNLSAETVNGSTEVDGVDGRVRAETVNGAVSIEGGRGDVDAETVNGSVSITRTLGSESVRVGTVNGSVELHFAKGSSFSYEFETLNGRIESDFPMTVEGKYGPKSARGSIGHGGPRVFAETINGSIEVRGK